MATSIVVVSARADRSIGPRGKDGQRQLWKRAWRNGGIPVVAKRERERKSKTSSRQSCRGGFKFESSVRILLCYLYLLRCRLCPFVEEAQSEAGVHAPPGTNYFLARDNEPLLRSLIRRPASYLRPRLGHFVFGPRHSFFPPPPPCMPSVDEEAFLQLVSPSICEMYYTTTYALLIAYGRSITQDNTRQKM